MKLYQEEEFLLTNKLPEIMGYKKSARITCQEICDQTIGCLSILYLKSIIY